MTDRDSIFAAVLAQPVLMGIVNATPNSFSDGGAFVDGHGRIDATAATHFALGLVDQGAAILDIGGEASSFFRPGVVPIPSGQQIHRVVPIITALAATKPTVAATGQPLLISVDTRSAEVASAAVDAGADIINDISGGRFDPAMFAVAAAAQVPIILMHFRAEGAAPAPYPNVCSAVRQFLAERIAAAMAAGIPRHHIWLDPGIGFGKTPEDNWKLIAHLPCLVAMGHPVVLGASRKRFLAAADSAKALGGNKPAAFDWQERDAATAIVTALAAAHGVKVHRVHNVIENRKALGIAARAAQPIGTPLCDL